MSETAEILVVVATFLMLAGGLAFTVYELPRCHDTKPAIPRPPEPVSKSASTVGAVGEPGLLGEETVLNITNVGLSEAAAAEMDSGGPRTNKLGV